MAKLTGIGIYKLLPKTNCGECNFPTCMAFAMQVAAKKLALEACPYVSEEAKRELAESAAPPMRIVTIGAGPEAIQVGGETVLFRHEEKFHRPTALAIRVKDTEDVSAEIDAIHQLKEILANYKKTSNRIDVGKFKELIDVSRKYAIPLLEYLDRERITRRVGDVRILL